MVNAIGETIVEAGIIMSASGFAIEQVAVAFNKNIENAEAVIKGKK